MTTNANTLQIDDILGAGAEDAADLIFDMMGWAEDEIAAAQLRHPEHADRVWHSFMLIGPPASHLTFPGELTLRAHCRELLDRVAAGQDTRPGTSAECLLTLTTVSLQAPMPSPIVGLYARLWRQAGLPPIDYLSDNDNHYEALYASTIDDAQRWLRAKLAHPDRVLPDPIRHVRGCPDVEAGRAEPAPRANEPAAAEMAAAIEPPQIDLIALAMTRYGDRTPERIQP